MRLSLETLIGQRLTAVMVGPGRVQLNFDRDCALTIFNPILLTNPSGDVDCSHHGFEDSLRELIGRSVSNTDQKRGKETRVAIVFADAVVSIALKQGFRRPALLLVSSLPDLYNPPFFVVRNETELVPYPFDS